MPFWDDTPTDLLAETELPATGYGLRVLDRELSTRLAGLDERVRERSLRHPDPGAAAEIDVLCSAIAELRELRADVRRRLDELSRTWDRRRVGIRRWN